MTRPANIPTVDEAQANLDAALRLRKAFPQFALEMLVKATTIDLDEARDFVARGSVPVTVGSEIRYHDNASVWRTACVAKIGRRWVALNNGLRFDVETGLGESNIGWGSFVSRTDAYRLLGLRKARP